MDVRRRSGQDMVPLLARLLLEAVETEAQNAAETARVEGVSNEYGLG